MDATDPRLNDVQRAAIERANRTIDPVLALHAERDKVITKLYRLPMRDLVRLNGVLARLSDDDLRRVAAYAEGLAEWGSDATEASNR